MSPKWWALGLIFICVICINILTVTSDITFISVIARHSDRAPSPSADLYTNDPYKTNNFDPPGIGKLSPGGKLRAINLGKFLGNTYKNLLGLKYLPGSMEARSTDIARTKDSLASILLGLYPGTGIPTKVDLTLKDVLLYPQLCPDYVNDYVTSWKKHDGEYVKIKASIDKMSASTGWNMNKPINLYKLYTTLESEKSLNLTLPDWTKDLYPSGDLLKGILLEYDVMNDGYKMQKENGGRLIKKFNEDMQSLRRGTMRIHRKLSLNVGYDLNVVAVLKALGVYYPHVPQFSSALILELHHIGNDYFVQVGYYLGIPEKMNVLTIPGCKTLCPLDQFSTLMKNVIPSGLELQCDKDRSLMGITTLPAEPAAIMAIFKAIFSD